MVKVTQLKKSKKNFSSFSLKEAMKQLNITDLHPWQINAPAIAPSEFFQQRLKRFSTV